MEWWQILISSFSFVLAVVISVIGIIMAISIYRNTTSLNNAEKFWINNEEDLKSIIEEWKSNKEKEDPRNQLKSNIKNAVKSEEKSNIDEE